MNAISLDMHHQFVRDGKTYHVVFEPDHGRSRDFPTIALLSDQAGRVIARSLLFVTDKADRAYAKQFLDDYLNARKGS